MACCSVLDISSRIFHWGTIKQTEPCGVGGCQAVVTDRASRFRRSHEGLTTCEKCGKPLEREEGAWLGQRFKPGFVTDMERSAARAKHCPGNKGAGKDAFAPVCPTCQKPLQSETKPSLPTERGKAAYGGARQDANVIPCMTGWREEL